MLQGRQPTAGAATAEATNVSATDVEGVSAEQVREIATAAEKADPSVMDRVGAYYGEHPEVVKLLGGAALAIALGQLATRMKR